MLSSLAGAILSLFVSVEFSVTNRFWVESAKYLQAGPHGRGQHLSFVMCLTLNFYFKFIFIYLLLEVPMLLRRLFLSCSIYFLLILTFTFLFFCWCVFLLSEAFILYTFPFRRACTFPHPAGLSSWRWVASLKTNWYNIYYVLVWDLRQSSGRRSNDFLIADWRSCLTVDFEELVDAVVNVWFGTQFS